MEIGIGIGTSISKQQLINLFDYDTMSFGSVAGGIVSKLGNEETSLETTSVFSQQGVLLYDKFAYPANYKIVFYAKSDLATTGIQSIGDNGNTATEIESHNLTTDYQRYEYNINITGISLRLYFVGTGVSIGTFFYIKDLKIYAI